MMLIYEFILSQVAVANCTTNDVLFQAASHAINDQGSLTYLAHQLNTTTVGKSLPGLVAAYLSTHGSQADWNDFGANCLSMIDRLVEDFFTSLNIDVSESGYTRNATTAASSNGVYTCETSVNTFVYSEASNVLSWKSGQVMVSFQSVLDYISYVLTSESTVGSLSALINDRLGFCSGSALNGNAGLTDEVFLAMRNTLMGINS
jgi:hypothetical protein